MAVDNSAVDSCVPRGSSMKDARSVNSAVKLARVSGSNPNFDRGKSGCSDNRDHQ